VVAVKAAAITEAHDDDRGLEFLDIARWVGGLFTDAAVDPVGGLRAARRLR